MFPDVHKIKVLWEEEGGKRKGRGGQGGGEGGREAGRLLEVTSTTNRQSAHYTPGSHDAAP